MGRISTESARVAVGTSRQAQPQLSRSTAEPTHTDTPRASRAALYAHKTCAQRNAKLLSTFRAAVCIWLAARASLSSHSQKSQTIHTLPPTFFLLGVLFSLGAHPRLGLIGEHRLEPAAHVTRDRDSLLEEFEVGLDDRVEAEGGHVRACDRTRLLVGTGGDDA